MKLSGKRLHATLMRERERDDFIAIMEESRTRQLYTSKVRGIMNGADVSRSPVARSYAAITRMESLMQTFRQVLAPPRSDVKKGTHIVRSCSPRG
jgi:hypothetical protein